VSEEKKLFGTDGVRGTANLHPMTAEIALALGQAIAHVLRVPGGERRRIIIGKDTRLSGYVFEDALAAGICSMGVDVIQVGPMPTPGMAFLAQDMRCHAGVMRSPPATMPTRTTASSSSPTTATSCPTRWRNGSRR
jgi:phosphoglucosamine mutase